MAAEVIRVLLVEDNPGDARLLREALGEARGHYFHLEVAYKLSKGLERQAEGGIDVVLLDLSLPDSQGLETLSRWREQAPLTPVLVLTGHHDEDAGLRAVRLGAQDYLVKGQISGPALARSIRYGLERHRGLGGAAGAGLPMERSLDGGRVWGFVGAKGGVGATTVALNVAAALAQQGRRVVAIELVSFPAAFAFHLRATPGETLRSLLDRDLRQVTAAELGKHLFRCEFGLPVLFGPQRAQESQPLEAAEVETVVRAAQGAADEVVLDLPRAGSQTCGAALGHCGLVTLVFNQDPVSHRAAKAALELLRCRGFENGRVRPVAVGVQEAAGVETELGTPLAGCVPPAAAACLAAIKAGAPLVVSQPSSPAAVALQDLARRLASG